MKLLYWNVNGFGKHGAKDELKALCTRHRPDYVCISEPRILISSVPFGYWDSLQLAFVTANDRGPNYRGPSILPSLWIFRSLRVNIPDIVSISSQQISIMVAEMSTPMLLTFVYASNDLVRRRDLWAELVALSEPAKPWTVIWDFNAVLSIDDRRGTRRTSVR